MNDPEEARIQSLRDEHAAELAKVREERASLRQMNDMLAAAIELMKKPREDDPA